MPGSLSKKPEAVESVILMKVIQAKTQKELLVIIGVLTFVLSSVLNNLTVATWQAEALEKCMYI